jgi:periplasmic protein TonB
MLHLLSPPASRPAPRQRLRAAAFCSMAHALAIGALLWLTVAHARDTRDTTPDLPVARLVWVAMPGPSGGGGGSPATVAPPPRLTPPPAARTLDTPTPTVIPTEITPSAPAPVEPAPPVAVVADSSSSGAAGPGPAATGNGTGGGGGTGDGKGAGPGQDQGFGDGAYRPGNGVTSPVPLRRAPPAYTAEAVRARAQGVVTVECVVEPNGECGEVRVLRAFNPPFGLDQEALAAARRWRFKPGMREGEPVPVLVNLEIEFTIR